MAVPKAKNSNRLLAKEKGFFILNLEFMVFPLAVDTVIFEHVGLQEQITNIKEISSETVRP